MVIRERAHCFFACPLNCADSGGAMPGHVLPVATNLKAYSEYFSLYVR